MPLNVPQFPPLTEAQGELTAKIGSMKSLLALPFRAKKDIPKERQISTFDYLLRLLNAMGLTPETVFNAFLTKVFDQAGTFLEDKVIAAIGDALGEQGLQLNPFIDNRSIASTLTKDVKKQYKASNKQYLASIIPNTFLQTVKQDLAKKLVLMLFGPRSGPAAAALVPSQAERDRLISNAVCGSFNFSLSNDYIVNNNDIEYNKIKLQSELEKGEVVYEISCQSVKVKLPANPDSFFTGGGQFTAPSANVPPAQSLNAVIQHVNNQTQKINNETNANQAGKRFGQILIEKLITFIATLVEPYLPNVFAQIQADLTSRSITATVPMSSVVFSSCDIANNTNSSTSDEQKEFQRSLLNALLKDLLKLLLLFAIKKFKQLVANYFARTALERQQRKVEKLRKKYEVFYSQGADIASKVQRYQAALSTLNSIIQG